MWPIVNRIWVLTIGVMLMQSCVTSGGAQNRGAGWYLMKPTDSIHSVAWRYDLDVNDIARWNGLSNAETVKPGDYIRLIEPERYEEVQQPKKISSRKIKRPVTAKKTTKKTVKKPIPSSTKSLLSWQWPTKGKLLNRFSVNDVHKRGIDIAGKLRQPIHAVSSGRVVYSGNGLDGYTNLIIIKHNEQYLSAYSNNENRLVKEGQTIKKGMKIAEMGKDGDNNYILHFQIRKNGKPVDPLKYLPDNKN